MLGQSRAVGFDPDGVPRLGHRAAPEAGPHEVAVDVRFAGINPTDTYHRRRVAETGAEADRIPGVEVAGVVAAVGSESRRWRVGDRVLGLVHDGGLSDRVVASAELLARVPDELTMREAAAIPEAFTTAHDGIRQGALARGEVLLVTGATGAVGLAAVQIGRELGAAKVIGISRSEAGRDRLAALGIEARVGHRDDDDMPYRDSVDVVVELVGAINARADLAALRPRGRMVFIAAQGDEDISFNLREFKTKRATLIGSTLRRRGFEAKVEAFRAFEREVLPMLARRAAVPTVASVFPASSAAEAFDFMAAPGKHGKVLLEFA